jgi:glucosamine kinase
VAYYIGIDGGGTKTRSAVGDESSVLAKVVTGPSNITRVGEAGAREALHKAIREACAAAKIDVSEVRRACVGAAGAGRTEVASLVRRIVAEVISGEIEITGDMPIALEAAFGEGPGVIVIAGTGSIAYGRNHQGETARCGGWGFAISDEGSAHWIGRTAVREVLRAKDEGENSPPLLQQLMQVRRETSCDKFIRAVNADHDFAEFFPSVVETAQAGDSLARRVLTEAGVELAQLAAIVIGRLFKEKDFAVPLAMVGGVFRHAALVREVFYNQVRSVHRAIELKPEIIEPVLGALQMARRST